MAPPSSKHGQDPKTNNEMESQLKYNLEDKSAKRKAGRRFDRNNYPKKDNLSNNLKYI